MNFVSKLMDSEVSPDRVEAANWTSAEPATEVETALTDANDVTKDVTGSGENNTIGITSDDAQLTPSVVCGVAVDSESMIHFNSSVKITLRV